MNAQPVPKVLEVEDLVVRYPIHRGLVATVARRPRRNVHAVEGVSLSLQRGEMLALVGESGCGKTTTAQAVLRLVDPVSGAIRFDGRDLVPLGSRELRPLRRRIQVVYQDPYESLDPRFRVKAVVEEPLLIHGLGGSKAESQRGLNGQPSIARSSRGGAPAIESTGSSSPARSGDAANSMRLYGCPGEW